MTSEEGGSIFGEEETHPLCGQKKTQAFPWTLQIPREKKGTVDGEESRKQRKGGKDWRTKKRLPSWVRSMPSLQENKKAQRREQVAATTKRKIKTTKVRYRGDVGLVSPSGLGAVSKDRYTN